jgi:3-deoxy-D-manno-octulosonic-acid transferase
MIDLFCFAVYRFFLIPIAFAVLRIFRPFWPEKIRRMIEDRRQKNFQHLPSRPFWIHASSGEIEYAKSVIRALKEKYPQVPVLVTYFSPSAKKLIQKFEGVDLAMPLPWDTRAAVSKFLRFYQPRLLLVARTDVWPEMAYQARQRKIPSLLFAATLAERSSRRGFLSRPLSRFAFHCLDDIFCVSEADENNFAGLKVKTPMQIAGDTRFDQVLYRLHHPQELRPELKPQGHPPVFIIGSSWPQDEAVILPTLKTWCQDGRKVILAPHETKPERIQNLEAKLRDLGLSLTKVSLTDGWRDEAVLLVDQIGLLQELYALAARAPGSLAFVGGSFKDKVHSVMEPLACGLPVAVGPYHMNNREALQFQHVILAPDFCAVNVVQTSEDLAEILRLSLVHPETEDLIRRKVEAQSQATDRVLSWVTNVVP